MVSKDILKIDNSFKIYTYGDSILNNDFDKFILKFIDKLKEGVTRLFKKDKFVNFDNIVIKYKQTYNKEYRIICTYSDVPILAFSVINNILFVEYIDELKMEGTDFIIMQYHFVNSYWVDDITTQLEYIFDEADFLLNCLERMKSFSIYGLDNYNSIVRL